MPTVLLFCFFFFSLLLHFSRLFFLQNSLFCLVHWVVCGDVFVPLLSKCFCYRHAKMVASLIYSLLFFFLSTLQSSLGCKKYSRLRIFSSILAAFSRFSSPKFVEFSRGKSFKIHLLVCRMLGHSSSSYAAGKDRFSRTEHILPSVLNNPLPNL